LVVRGSQSHHNAFRGDRTKKLCYVRISETGTIVSIFTVDEDFVRNTLDAVPGLWGKLRYVSALRQPDGRYKHWGLMRKYGENTAEKAIRQVHRELALQVLRIPLRELMNETAGAAAQSEIPLREFVARLVVERNNLLPADFGGGSARHFTTVVEALSSLTQAGKDANRQAS
jgi:hypothetical protein